MVMAVGAGMAKPSDAGSEGSIESSLLRYLYCVRLLSPEPRKGIHKSLHRFTVTSTTFIKLVIWLLKRPVLQIAVQLICVWGVYRGPSKSA